MIIERVIVGELETNCYILGSEESGKAIIIDPGDDFQKIVDVVEKNNLSVKFVVNTHAHLDHIGANSKFNVPVLVHTDDMQFFSSPKLNLSAFLNRPVALSSTYKALTDNDKVILGEITLEVIHTPGHTPGGICLKKENDFIFTGDTLFAAGIGRTDLPLGSERSLKKSIKERLLTLNEDMVIYPGHGPSSTIGREKEGNPFLTE